MSKQKKTGAMQKTLRVMALALAVVLIITATIEFYIAREPYILFGTKIQQVNVGGLSKAAATKKLQQELAKTYQGRICLIINQKTYAYTPWELGLTGDLEAALTTAYQQGRTGGLLRRWQERKTKASIPLAFRWQEETFATHLKPLANLYRQAPREAKVVTGQDPNFGLSYRQEQNGYFLDLEAAFARVSGLKLQTLGRGSCPVSLATTAIQAFPTQNDLKEWGLSNKIGGYTTYYNAKNNRGANIELAASFLDNQLLYPYQILSLNQVLGERTEDKGYLPAPTIVGEGYEEQLGGGICQVASTLYNAVLETNQLGVAGFQILERHPHSLAVDYVPPKQDATLAYGYKDLRFFQKGATPLLIRAVAKSGVLEVSLYGARP